jgi:hypothetical protein
VLPLLPILALSSCPLYADFYIDLLHYLISLSAST